MLDIKAKIEEVVEKVTKDDKLRRDFKSDPVKAVEGLLGVDLPDGAVDKIVDGVKAKLSLDGAKDLADKIKGLF